MVWVGRYWGERTQYRETGNVFSAERPLTSANCGNGGAGGAGGEGGSGGGAGGGDGEGVDVHPCSSEVYAWTGASSPPHVTRA